LAYLGPVTNFVVQFFSWSCYNYSFTWSRSSQWNL